MPNDRQSQTKSTKLLGGAGVRLAETLEDVRQEVRANTLTVVLPQSVLSGDGLELNVYLRTARTKLNRI